MKLYLARHATALGPEIDIKRPLSEKGKKEITRLANFLSPAGVLASQVFHSGKLRAQQTAEILATAIAHGQPINILPELDSPDAVTTLAEKISGWADDTLLVGHIPVLPRLLGELVVQNENQFIVDFQPATIVCLQRIDIVRWCILWVLRPDLVPNGYQNLSKLTF